MFYVDLSTELCYELACQIRRGGSSKSSPLHLLPGFVAPDTIPTTKVVDKNTPFAQLTGVLIQHILRHV